MQLNGRVTEKNFNIQNATQRRKYVTSEFRDSRQYKRLIPGITCTNLKSLCSIRLANFFVNGSFLYQGDGRNNVAFFRIGKIRHRAPIKRLLFSYYLKPTYQVYRGSNQSILPTLPPNTFFCQPGSFSQRQGRRQGPWERGCTLRASFYLSIVRPKHAPLPEGKTKLAHIPLSKDKIARWTYYLQTSNLIKRMVSHYYDKGSEKTTCRWNLPEVSDTK